jgi:hypothetical protein
LLELEKYLISTDIKDFCEKKMGPNSWATIKFKRKKENPPDCYNRFQAVTKISKNSF